MKNPKFSVLMSLYIKEKAAYFDACMQSLMRQTVQPSEIVIVKDGPIAEDVRVLLNKYIEQNPGLIKTVPLEQNRGLGLALAEGILHCSYELIARMDTDDIAREDRFEKQLAAFAEDPALDICGSYIQEFEGTPDNVLSVREVPLSHEGIAKYQKQRCAFNHVTVMYKKSAVLKAGNYKDAPLMEDDVLWVDMLRSGARCRNLDECLVYVRTGREMISRRGGTAYLKKYCQGRKQILATGYISRWDYWKTAVAQTIVALLPEKLRLLVFLKLLRN